MSFAADRLIPDKPYKRGEGNQRDWNPKFNDIPAPIDDKADHIYPHDKAPAVPIDHRITKY